jgi:hypothetical protein
MARKRIKKPAKGVYLTQVPEMPNLYHICNLARAWEEWWRVLLSFRGGDYGVILAGKDERAGDGATENEWNYVTRDTDPELWVCWQRGFIETELEDPNVYVQVLSWGLQGTSRCHVYFRQCQALCNGTPERRGYVTDG